MNKILIDLPEYIETPSLALQMPKAGMGARLYQAIADGYDDYVKFLNWPVELPSLQSVEEDCRKHHAEFILREFIRYIIIEKSTNEVVGRTAFPSFQAEWRVPRFGIAYFIRRSARSRGYATEAARALTLLAFNTLKARKVEIYCDTENIASWKVPEKLGFKLEYTSIGGWPRQDGKLAELRTYCIFNTASLNI